VSEDPSSEQIRRTPIRQLATWWESLSVLRKITYAVITMLGLAMISGMVDASRIDPDLQSDYEVCQEFRTYLVARDGKSLSQRHNELMGMFRKVERSRSEHINKTALEVLAGFEESGDIQLFDDFASVVSGDCWTVEWRWNAWHNSND